MTEIKKTYLVFPVSRTALKKSVSIWHEGECVYDLDLRLDYVTAEYEVYVDVRRFIGMSVEISVSPEMELVIKQKDRRSVCRFREPLRPRYHFTPPDGWMNDPNGLVYTNGVYHFFYQTNPVGTEWGNMHWGHATSSNLVDWEHKNIALFPDKTGTMFSGGGICDEANLLGLKGDTPRPVMLLYYTAAGSTSLASAGQPFTQCLAYSLDGGETFTKAIGNPIIPHMVGTNRDPKVVYSEGLGIYVMSLYLEGERYAILTSRNLKEWERAMEIELPLDNECPAFFPLKHKGTEKWVLMGAHDRYVIGDFDGTRFTPDFEGSRQFNYNDSATYAAQRFEGISGGRTVRFSWLKTDFYSLGATFNSAMTVPQELTLSDNEEGETVLRVLPAKEFERLRGRKIKTKLKCTEYSMRVSGIATEIILTVKPNDARSIRFSLFGSSFEMDTVNGTFTDGKATAPLSKNASELTVRLLTDTCGFEIYLMNGLAYMAKNSVPDANLNELKLISDSEIELRLESYKLRSARWNDKRK